ncbi:MAG TPA: BON domain-containing protein [Bryobacteraceae bacterium]|nr:BON domain-containing protein [Bryobacteraceae bacterium]
MDLRIISKGVLALALGASAMFAQSTQPDNTKANKQDRSSSAVTADQQKENSSDRDMAKKIRKAIVDDKNLSTYAHNVKVIVRDGAVTLKGPVHTAEEKSAVMAHATEVAGASNVTDQITVKGDASEADRSKPKQ